MYCDTVRLHSYTMCTKLTGCSDGGLVQDIIALKIPDTLQTNARVRHSQLIIKEKAKSLPRPHPLRILLGFSFYSTSGHLY